MKRFLLFVGDNYYPSGGMEDFVDSFDTLKEAKNALLSENMPAHNWWHIFDSEECMVYGEHRTERLEDASLTRREYLSNKGSIY